MTKEQKVFTSAWNGEREKMLANSEVMPYTTKKI